MSNRIKWPSLLAEAAEIVESYDTGVTLRQLFYRLVSKGMLPNTKSAYCSLSHYTAQARRYRDFPALIDRTRTIHRYPTFNDVADARSWLKSIYRRDRTEGQEWSVYVGVEKAGIVEQLRAWYGDLGIPIIALGGYSSESYIEEIVTDVRAQERPAVLIYAGDFDPTGTDIDRDFVDRSQCFAKVHRVALNPEQISEYHLPPLAGKASDTRAARFVEKHGELIQVELDALPPDILRKLYSAAIDLYLDVSQYEAVVKQEAREREAVTQ